MPPPRGRPSVGVGASSPSSNISPSTATLRPRGAGEQFEQPVHRHRRRVIAVVHHRDPALQVQDPAPVLGARRRSRAVSATCSAVTPKAAAAAAAASRFSAWCSPGKPSSTSASEPGRTRWKRLPRRPRSSKSRPSPRHQVLRTLSNTSRGLAREFPLPRIVRVDDQRALGVEPGKSSALARTMPSMSGKNSVWTVGDSGVEQDFGPEDATEYRELARAAHAGLGHEVLDRLGLGQQLRRADRGCCCGCPVTNRWDCAGRPTRREFPWWWSCRPSP